MEIILWVGSVVIAILISHFYYRRSISKALSFFLLLDDKPLSHVSKDVRERLEFKFKSSPKQPSEEGDKRLAAEEPQSIGIDALHNLQFVIANTGIRAITFAENPSIDIPTDNLILDASIIHQKPDNLGAGVIRLPVGQGECQRIKITVPMLNKGEYVILKLLLSGVLDTSALKLRLLSEDLERNIDLAELPTDSTKSFRESIDWMAIWVGALLILFCSAIVIVCDAYNKSNLVHAKGAVDLILKWLDVSHIALMLAMLGSFLLGLFGFALLLGIGLIGPFKRVRLVIPAELRTTQIGTK